jgi:hypothetical protein
LCTYVLGPHRFWFRGNRWTSTRFQMNEGKGKNLRSTFVCSAASELMQLAAKRMGNEGLRYIHLARRPFLYFWRLATHSVSGVEVRILFVRDEKTKVSSKVSSNETSQPTHHPTQTNQPVKNKTSCRAQGGEQESTKAQADKLETFFSRA